MKVALFSDLHIGVHKNSTEWQKIALKWCSWFCKEIKSQKIEHVIFCGDWFHHRDSIDVRSLNVANAIINAISKDCHLHLLIGNHDCYYKDTTSINSIQQWSEIDNVSVYNTLSNVQLDNNNIVFAPWGTDMYNLPDGDILIAHCELNNFKLNNNRISDCKLEANTILDKIPLAFIGHIHTRSERTYGNEKKIIYVGNPFEMDFNDEGNTKGFYIFDTTDKSIQFIENNISPKHKKVFASKIDSIDQTEMSNAIIKLIVDKKIDDTELTQIKSKISTSSPFQITDTDYVDQYQNIQTETGEYDISNVSIEDIIEEFVNKLDIEYKEEILEKTLNSYKSHYNG